MEVGRVEVGLSRTGHVRPTVPGEFGKSALHYKLAPIHETKRSYTPNSFVSGPL